MGKRADPVLRNALVSTACAALICVGMVVSSLHAEEAGGFSRADELMDWGSLQASQQMAQYRAAFQLDRSTSADVADANDNTGGLQLRMSDGADQELEHLAALTAKVMPEEAVHQVGGKKTGSSSEAMLAHWSSINNEVFPSSKARRGAADMERETSGQELARLKKLSADVWPADRHHAASKGARDTAAKMLSHYGAINDAVFPAVQGRKDKAETAQEELAHFKAVSDAVFPKQANGVKRQSAQGMLARYAKLNDLVFPKEAGKAHGKRVQDV